jgi:hypothetical protein
MDNRALSEGDICTQSNGARSTEALAAAAEERAKRASEVPNANVTGGDA